MIKKTLCDIMNGYSMPEGKSPSGILFVSAGTGTDPVRQKPPLQRERTVQML